MTPLPPSTELKATLTISPITRPICTPRPCPCRWGSTPSTAPTPTPSRTTHSLTLPKTHPRSHPINTTNPIEPSLPSNLSHNPPMTVPMTASTKYPHRHPCTTTPATLTRPTTTMNVSDRPSSVRNNNVQVGSGSTLMN